jgi:hypothetical protein
MGERIATCDCGKVRVTCSGEPFRISMCHCLACLQRTGAPFGVQSWFQRDPLVIAGDSAADVRTVDSDHKVVNQLCPDCGSTVYWELTRTPGVVAIALGMFADPSFPPPRVSLWERRRHSWTVHVAECQMEHNA